MNTMNMKKMVASLAVAALPLGLFVGHAAAEEATDTVDVYAGLASVIELVCEDVNFGVWRVPTGDRTGTNTITLASDNTVTVGGTGVGTIALSTDYLGPQAGACTVSGSSAADDATGAASILVTSGAMATSGAAGGNQFAVSLAGPEAEGNMDYTLALTSATPAISSGAASFGITGVLTISASILNSNYGSYKGSASHTVAFDDSI